MGGNRHISAWLLKSSGRSAFGGVVHRRGRLCKKPPPMSASFRPFLAETRKGWICGAGCSVCVTLSLPFGGRIWYTFIKRRGFAWPMKNWKQNWMNPDTFMLFLSVAGGVPTVQMMNKGMRYWLQNGFGAFTDLLAKYFTFLRAGDNVEINGDNVATQSIARMKRQTLKLTSAQDILPNSQIKTSVGVATLEENSINLYSRLNQLTIRLRWFWTITY